jgi:glycosyltransferase 2 family protein
MQSLESFWNAAGAFADSLTEVGLRALAIAVAFHLANMLLRGTAWRNILVAAHEPRPVRWRSVTGAYLAGVAVNSVVPARGGDVTKVYLAHRGIPGIAYGTVVASLLAETAFDVVVGLVLLLWALEAGVIPFGADVLARLHAFEWGVVVTHGTVVLAVVGALLLVGLVTWPWTRRRVRRFWRSVADGVVILRSPRRYLRQVVVLQAIGWACRVASSYYFLQAFHIPAGIDDAALALSAGSLATLAPVTPGGVGPQQALLVYMFAGAAARSTVLSYSVGMQAVVVGVNAIVGGVAIMLMMRRLPWQAQLSETSAGAG